MFIFSEYVSFVAIFTIFFTGVIACIAVIFLIVNFTGESIPGAEDEPERDRVLTEQTFLSYYNDRFVDDETSIGNLKFDGQRLPMFDGPSLFSFVKYVLLRERMNNIKDQS